MIYTNVMGTANLVNLCLQNQCRLLHVSSIAAIGQAKPGELITEKHHLDQATETDGYAISKLESEMEVWRGVAEGLNAVIVNPSASLLVRMQEPKAVGHYLKLYAKAWEILCVPNGGMGFVDVVDVAKCMIALMNSKINGERYIISAENISYKDITAEIANDFGIKPPATLAKPWMMELAWRGASVAAAISRKAPAIDKVSAQEASVVKKFDNSKVKKATGIEFKPMRISSKEVCGSAISQGSFTVLLYSSELTFVSLSASTPFLFTFKILIIILPFELANKFRSFFRNLIRYM